MTVLGPHSPPGFARPSGIGYDDKFKHHRADAISEPTLDEPRVRREASDRRLIRLDRALGPPSTLTFAQSAFAELTDPPPEPFSYQARRMSMSINVSVDNDVLDWRYVFDGDEWKQSIPLYMLLPKPMISIERGRCWRNLGLTFIIPLAVVGLVQWLEFGSAATIGAGIGAFLVLAYRYSPWFLGPVEWAIFDTTLKDKTVYMFRGFDTSEFEKFVEKLEDAIEHSRRNVSIVGEPSDAPQPRNEAF